MIQHALNWFEIYAADFDRAAGFYETIMGTTLERVDNDCGQMAMFPYEENKVISGAIAKMDHCGPGPGGTMVYLNAEGILDDVIGRIPGAGGKIIKERTEIPPHGSIAIFEDSEGNVVGLHSMS